MAGHKHGRSNRTMFPDDQEPLARDLTMKASRRNSRRSGIPQGGMPNILRPMDSLEAQEAMDAMQYEDPPSQGPFRLALDDGSAAPIQTVQQRQSGARMDCSTGKCRVVQQPVQQAMQTQQRSTLAQQLGLPPGATVTAVDGVPVGQGMGFPAPPPPASFQAMPSGGVVNNPPPVAPNAGGDDYIKRAGALLRPHNAFMADMAESAATIADGQVASAIAANAPADARAERQAVNNDLITDVEVKTQLGNLEAQSDQTIRGSIRKLDDVIKGQDDMQGRNALVRATVVTNALQAQYNSNAKENAPPFEYQKTLNLVQGQLIASDLSHLVTQHAVYTLMGTPGNQDQMKFAKGASEYMDEMFVGAYRGRKNADGSMLRGDSLRDVMGDELLKPLADTLRDDFMKKYPGADAKQALLHAQNLSFQIVQNYYVQIDYANAAMEGGGNIGRSVFNSAMDAMATYGKMLQAGPPTQAYGVTPPQPHATGTTAPR